MALPRDDRLMEEAMAVEWELNKASNRIQILGKDVIRSLLGRSPDTLDAVVMGLGVSMGFSEHRATVHGFAI